MNEGLIPRRYAKALYGFASERNAGERVYCLVKTLADTFVETPGLQDVLDNPYVADADKMQVLVTAAESSDSDDVYNDFLKMLAGNHRLGIIRDVALAYIRLYRERHDIYDVKVVSAAPMSSEDESRLRTLISDHLHGAVMEYACSIDPSLIGGFTVSVGNERLDASISNELKQMRLNLLSK